MRFTLHNIAAVILASLVLGFSSNALADSTDDIINILVAKGVLTEEEGALIRDSRTEERDATEKVAKKQANIEVGKKGLVVKSGDGSFSMQVGGRLHADAFHHSGDDDLTSGKAINGTEIRRARIYLKGKAHEDFKYHIETDFADNKVSVKDLFLGYTGFNAPLELIVGNQKHAMSMEIEESSNDIMFTERSLVTALTTPYFDRALGVTLRGYGDNWHVKGGFYGDGISPGSSKNDEGHGVAIRASFAPIMDEKKLLHVGASLGRRSLSDDNKTSNVKSPSFSYETTHGSSLKLLNTGVVADVDDVQIGILELAAKYGPLSFQSEIAKTKVDRDVGSDVDFTGFYAQIGYTLTGESRPYKGSEGEFKGLKPAKHFSLKKGTWGAWEVAARYDQLDLNDGTIAGGDGKRYTVALNWYLNDNMRILGDYSRTFDISKGPVTQLDGSDADDIDVLTVRTQWAF
jgi:phosphate-selective porin OprO/OprP